MSLGLAGGQNRRPTRRACAVNTAGGGGRMTEARGPASGGDLVAGPAAGELRRVLRMRAVA